MPFEIDDAVDPSLVTGCAGVPLVFELFPQLGVTQVIDEQVQLKQRQRGLRRSHLVDALIALCVSGGDQCQDLTSLREEQALATPLRYVLPAATTVRHPLETFHIADLSL